ncbi:MULTISPECIES: retron system putative HNH endonuclease [unclassified Roseovarius]|uniref:retron system putative HNH endonuclease n=1 Tax=unclassified Roseovarius TaxID=2614913 RepID=UPI00273F269B|nr:MULTISPECIES: retron system putative HNH endonuclease [unclassified Roseovarius]
MRGSSKGPPPTTFVEWLALGQDNEDWTATYNALSGAEKTDLRLSLLREQTGQCVYCGRKLDLNDPRFSHIEHFRPQSDYPELELDYKNLFMSCGPMDNDGNALEVCGNKKGNWFDEKCHVSPFPEARCVSLFSYQSTGEIASAAANANKMIDVLNLNDPELVRERKELVRGLDEELVLENAVVLLDNWKRTDTAYFRKSFANVAIGYLESQPEAK